MNDDLIEQYKAQELELRRQLEEAKAEKARLEMEIKYKDKTTDLWNRKYLEKVVSEGKAGSENENFLIFCMDIDNLRRVNESAGDNAGDELLKTFAFNLQKAMGEEAICCKLAGTKMCALLTASVEEMDEKLVGLDNFISTITDVYTDINVSYGMAWHKDHNDKEVDALIKEAEYAMHVGMLKKEESNFKNIDATADNVESDAQTDISQTSEPHKKGKGQTTILMIDDSMIILRTLQMMLKDDYRLILSTSGIEGYEIAKEKKPDLILLDYNMPAVDGARIMYLLRKTVATKDIPVVFITGVTDKEKILKVASLNPAGYLLKPVNKDDLMRTIDSALK